MSEVRKRRVHSAEFKAKGGMEAVRGVKTLNNTVGNAANGQAKRIQCRHRNVVADPTVDHPRLHRDHVDCKRQCTGRRP